MYQNKKHAFRLSMVDFAIILITLVILCGGLLFLNRTVLQEEPSLLIHYTVRVEGIEKGEALTRLTTLVKPDVKVYSENGTAFMGTVISVTEVPHYKTVFQNDAVQTVLVNDLTDLLITVRSEASLEKGNGIRVSDIRIAACGRGTFRFGGYYAKNALIARVEAEEI